MGYTATVEVLQAVLSAVRIGHPAKQVVEAAVLHHDDNDALNAGEFRAGQQGINCLCSRLT